MTYISHEITVAPALQPVTLAEARMQLRNEDLSFDDGYIEALISAAVAAIEVQYSLAIMTQTIKDYHSQFGTMVVLSRRGIGNIGTITAVNYTDTNGDNTPLSTDVYAQGRYTARTAIYLKGGQSWPTIAESLHPVVITYTAGATSAADVPTNIKQAILIMVSDWYVHRDNPTRVLPTAAERLLEPYYRHGG